MNQIVIIGNQIDCFESYESFYNSVLIELKCQQTGYVTVNNVHTLMEGFWNQDYRMIINKSNFSIPDGKPLEIVGKLKGDKKITRLFGPTIMEKFIDWGRKDNLRHFFFGSSNSTLEMLKASIEVKYPGAIIAGMFSPPFAPAKQWDDTAYLKIINETNPHFVWIGLGAPKQEFWMSKNIPFLNNGFMFGIGAGFDYLAGKTKHAPKWMKDASLEWLYRLIQEPKRLWKRYLKTIPQFLVLSTLDVFGIELRKRN